MEHEPGAHQDSPEENQPPEPQPPQPGDQRYDAATGLTFEYAPTRYSLRTFFSHHTEGFGAGPGWDMLMFYASDPAAAMARFGREISLEEARDPSLLPDDVPVYGWELLSEEQDKEAR